MIITTTRGDISTDFKGGIWVEGEKKMKFSEAIKAARIEKGLTLTKAGEALGIDQSHVWRLEHGTQPLLFLAVKIAKFYCLNLDNLEA